MRGKNEIRIPWYRRTIRKHEVEVIQNNSQHSMKLNVRIPFPFPVLEPVPVRVPDPVTAPNPNTVKVPKDLRQPFLNPNIEPDVINSPIPNPIPEDLRNPFGNNIFTPAPDVIQNPLPIPDRIKPKDIPTPAPDIFNQPIPTPSLFDRNALENFVNTKVDTGRAQFFKNNNIYDFGFSMGIEEQQKAGFVQNILNQVTQSNVVTNTVDVSNYLLNYNYTEFSPTGMYKDLVPIVGATVAIAIIGYIVISIPLGIPGVPFA